MVENFDEWFHDILEQADITDSMFLKLNLQRKGYMLRDLKMKCTGLQKADKPN